MLLEPLGGQDFLCTARKQALGNKEAPLLALNPSAATAESPAMLPGRMAGFAPAAEPKP